MKQILIAAHGKMASGIRYTLELVVGKMEEITTIDAYVNPEDDVEKMLQEYFSVHKGERIFAFTDLRGGSVNQKLMQYADRPGVTLITGMNLPVLLQVALAGEDVSDEEIGGFIRAAREELQLISLKAAGRKAAAGQTPGAGQVSAGEQAPAADQTSAARQTPGAGQVSTAGQAPAAGQNPVADQAPPAAPNPAAPNPAAVSLPAPAASLTSSRAQITALRVDDRLIHGQVAMTWTKQLRVDGIVVANDDAAGDPTQKMALQMAVPAGIRVLVKPVQEAIRALNYPKASQMRILVLTRTVRDALAVRRGVDGIGFVNVGNVGRFDGIDISRKKVLTPTIMLTEDEIKSLEELLKLEPEACMQQVPGDEQKLVRDVIGKLR